GRVDLDDTRGGPRDGCQNSPGSELSLVLVGRRLVRRVRVRIWPLPHTHGVGAVGEGLVELQELESCRAVGEKRGRAGGCQRDAREASGATGPKACLGDVVGSRWVWARRWLRAIRRGDRAHAGTTCGWTTD